LVSQQYQVPSSNGTIDKARNIFTYQFIQVTKIPNKPLSQGYMFYCMAEKGYVWEFHPSSNTIGGDGVDVEFYLLKL
jgi:hypothetical protein